jgi:hypothetical protein
MLKDLDRHSEGEFSPECCTNEHDESDGREERGCAQFRVSLWLGIAADLRHERASRAKKGHVSC